MKKRKKIIAVVIVIIIITTTIGIYWFWSTNVQGLNEIDEYLKLTSDEKNYLESHNFVFVSEPPKQYKTFEMAYNDLHDEYVPILITSDSILHTYHVFFDDTLRMIEEIYLYNDTINLSRAMFESAYIRYNETTNSYLKELARRNLAFFSVALELLNPDFILPEVISSDVNAEIELINNHNKIECSPVYDDTGSIFHPDAIAEDYTQYKPRGHYTHSVTLKRYFKTMMWYGRIPFYLRIDNMTICAIMIVEDMQSASFNGKAIEHWDKIYSVTERFVGESEDLTHANYWGIIESIYGTEIDENELLNPIQLNEFKTKASTLKKPVILSAFVYEDNFDDMGVYTQAYRFMGQRYIPDSYIFTNLVSNLKNKLNYTGGSKKPFTYVNVNGEYRGFPRGLDAMAVLGNKAAEKAIKKEGDDQYEDYLKVRGELKAEFDQLTEDNWTSNMYMGWLYSLKSLNNEFKDEKYPSFMRDSKWPYVKLNTNLASWAELRHDTILYAKQSYSGLQAGGGFTQEPKEEGYVEPVVVLYDRLIDLTTMTKNMLKAEQVLNNEREEDLDMFIDMIKNLKKISNKELDGKSLNEADYDYIKTFGEKLERITGRADSKGKETTIIADVHTEVNTGKCLEEGVGYIDYVVVKVKRPDGTWAAMCGPVFSYYEFKHPMEKRLTDEEWKDLLKSSNAPKQTVWV